MNVDEKHQKPPPIPLPDEDDWSTQRSTPVPEPAQLRPNPKGKAKALVRRPAQPTITDLSGHTSVGGGTLRPPGAVPPPPRGVPRSLLDENGEPLIDESATPSIGSVALTQRGHLHRPSSSLHRKSAGPPSTAASVANAVAPKSGQVSSRAAANALDPSCSPADLEGHPRQTLPSPAAGKAGQASQHGESATADSERQPSRAVSTGFIAAQGPGNRPAASMAGAQANSERPSTRKRQWIGLLLGVTVIAVGAGVLLVRPTAAPTASVAPSSSPVPIRAVACAPSKPARRIAPTVLMSVSPIASYGLVGGRILVGFAENPSTAVGLAVDPNDLDIAIPYRERSDQRVVSVTPFEAGDEPRFFAWRERDGLRKGRLVNATVDFAFGVSDTGFARQPVGGSAETVWPIDTRVTVTDPRIATLPGRGHAVAFRQGGQAGTMMLGWLSETGQSLTGPYPVDSPVTVLGTPTVAANSHTALLAFAGKTAEPDAWSLYLSRATYGQPPETARALPHPQGGPGGDAIAPSLTQVAQDHWLLQWSEGAQGQRQVRVQTLDETGHPRGMAHTVSPIGSNSGQGLLWSSGSRAVSLFIVSSSQSAELWATPMTCQP